MIETLKNVWWAGAAVLTIVGGLWTFVGEPALAGSVKQQIDVQVNNRINELEGGVGRLKLKTNETNLAVKEIQIEQRALNREIDKTNTLLLQVLQQLRRAPVGGQ